MLRLRVAKTDRTRNKKTSPQPGWLKRQNAQEHLAVFVGAGVAFGCGLPDWEELIRRLAEAAFPGSDADEALRPFSPIARTHVIRNALGKRFNTAVADALYANAYTISPAVKAIVSAGVRRICTYNFDDLLEEALTVHGVPFESLGPGDKLNSTSNETIVFHPHGILSATMTPEECAVQRLVLSEEDYHQLYSNPYSWANLVQLWLLMTCSCVFVGVSLTDPNIRRLLDTCRALPIAHQHFAIIRTPTSGLPLGSHKLGKELIRAHESDLRSLGVEPIWIEDFAEVAQLFRYLCR
jgi:SIR2-like domain